MSEPVLASGAFGRELCSALGLPDNTFSVEIQAVAGKHVLITAKHWPSADQLWRGLGVITQYELRERDPSPPKEPAAENDDGAAAGGGQ